jgi:hypothetical protein
MGGAGGSRAGDGDHGKRCAGRGCLDPRDPGPGRRGRARCHHDDPRRHDRQRGVADPGPGPAHLDLGHPVGAHHLPAGLRLRDPANGVDRRPVRGQAGVAGLARAFHSRLAAGWAVPLDRGADRLPGRAGPRRRDDHAARPADPGPGGRTEADGPGDEHRRGADAARPDLRPADRRVSHRRRQLAVDLLRQPARRPTRHRPCGPPAARRRHPLPPAPGRARCGPALGRAGAVPLRPGGKRPARPVDDTARAGPDDVRGRAGGVVRLARRAGTGSAHRPTAVPLPRLRHRHCGQLRAGHRPVRGGAAVAAVLPDPPRPEPISDRAAARPPKASAPPSRSAWPAT